MQDPDDTPRPPRRSTLRWVVAAFHLAMTVWFLVALTRAVGIYMGMEAGGAGTAASAWPGPGVAAGIWLAGGVVLAVLSHRSAGR
ncbi:hypothetical protein GXW77_01520 [Roseomonas alkaliterrae]|uniref:Uncharacterized protein n=1 Tax=Neoroseomonas alkaliterrae TaxID=1452450 RepID=A0A840XYU9_9PROT|nr:hypothetical protein [Neoroseomonas alkaliterrae]MBB5688971.1 hypothetical protein [Neoroseomonas alkaliterrae]MBR0674846.1 hypothetical protein [Neoroseomonas alkaliterrae]